MSEPYIDTREEISTLAEDIVKESKKADRLFRRYSDRVSFADWIKMLTDYISSLQSDRQRALDQLAEFNKDETIQYYKEAAEVAEADARRGFAITQDEKAAISKWQNEHLVKEHNLVTAKQQVQAFGCCGGNFSYSFYPTSIGTSGVCICGVCEKRAMQAVSELQKETAYNEYMKAHNGSFEFQELG